MQRKVILWAKMRGSLYLHPEKIFGQGKPDQGEHTRKKVGVGEGRTKKCEGPSD